MLTVQMMKGEGGLRLIMMQHRAHFTHSYNCVLSRGRHLSQVGREGAHKGVRYLGRLKNEEEEGRLNENEEGR